MKQVSLFRIPVLWLYAGPPIFRSLHARGALASLEGNIDGWNMFRLCWWAVWGAVGLCELLRNRASLSSVLHSSRVLTTTASLWLVSIAVSALYSPSPSFTLVYGLLMLVLICCALDLAVKLQLGAVTLGRLFHLCLKFSVGHMLVVAGCLIFAPELVILSYTPTLGPRILGGFVADVPLVSLAVFFIGINTTSPACTGRGCSGC